MAKKSQPENQSSITVNVKQDQSMEVLISGFEKLTPRKLEIAWDKVMHEFGLLKQQAVAAARRAEFAAQQEETING